MLALNLHVLDAPSNAIWDSVLKKMNSSVSVFTYILGALALSGCGIGCQPDTCSVGKEAIEQLDPIALSLQQFTEDRKLPPSDLTAVLGSDLPNGGEIKRAASGPTASYILTLPSSSKTIGVTYTHTNGKPDLSFGYASRWGLDTCSWDLEKADWLCFRRS